IVGGTADGSADRSVAIDRRGQKPQGNRGTIASQPKDGGGPRGGHQGTAGPGQRTRTGALCRELDGKTLNLYLAGRTSTSLSIQVGARCCLRAAFAGQEDTRNETPAGYKRTLHSHFGYLSPLCRLFSHCSGWRFDKSSSPPSTTGLM